MTNSKTIETLGNGLLAGAAGGLAEVVWVTLYAGITGVDPATVARGVTTAAGVSALVPVSPAMMGVTVHLALSLMLGVVLAIVWRTLRECRPALTNPFPLVMCALAGIWVANFFVILPIVSPYFVHIVPYAVSLTSKLLFGAAAAAVLVRQAAVAPIPQQHAA